jgi:hypothetical protein
MLGRYATSYHQRILLEGAETSILRTVPGPEGSLVLEAESDRHYLGGDETGGCIVVS